MSDDARPDAANNTTTATENSETSSVNANTAETAVSAPEKEQGTINGESASDVFPRSYVEELRKESAGYRDRAKQAEERADALAKRLHGELVRATDKLENPADLAYDADHLDDSDKLAAAIDALLNDRPYLRKRKVAGDAGQGPRGAETGVNLLELLRGRR